MTRMHLLYAIITVHLQKNNKYNRLKMGYFSQRKKHARENLFMVISLMVITIIYSILIFDNQDNAFTGFLRKWQFHFYLFNIILLAFTLWRRKYFYSLLALLLLILNYGSLAKTARLFFNETSDSTQAFNVVYKKGPQNYENILNADEVLIRRIGKIELSPDIHASFMSFEKYDQVVTLVNLDFSAAPDKQLPTAFANLAKFVANQDEPVVIVGDFKLPVWTPLFRDFLFKTGLHIKNRVLFTDGENYFKAFIVPSINVLGFDNIAIRRLKFMPESKSFDIKLVL